MERKLIPYIQALFPQPADAPVPNGDDATVVRTTGRTAVTVDTQVEQVHFQWEWGTPRQLGARLVGVVLSDLAAMGAKPRYGVLSLMIPRGFSLPRVKAWLRGVEQRASAEGLSVVGGDITNAPTFGAVLTAFGDAPRRPLTRHGARPGDRLCVSGPIGEAAWELAAMLAGKRKRARRWVAPPSRLQLGCALAADSRVTAAMDISDGLFLDALRMATASCLGVVVDVDRIPLSAALSRTLTGVRGEEKTNILGGGEDYELLVAVQAGTPIPDGLFPIGYFTAAETFLTEGGGRFSWPQVGHLHR